MLNRLLYTKNNLLHIHQQYQSTSQSLQFIHDILTILHEDLQQTIHTRKAQLKTMTTQTGIQLRNMVLSLHNNLAIYVDECIGMYRDVGEWVRGKCAGILEGVKEVEMCVGGYEDTLGFVKNKETKIQSELARLNKQSQQILKKQHINNLKQQYKLQLSRTSSSTATRNHNRSLSNSTTLQQINTRISTYTTEYKQVIQYMYSVLHKISNNIDAYVPKMKALQREVGNFGEIDGIVREYRGRLWGMLGMLGMDQGRGKDSTGRGRQSGSSRMKGSNRYGDIRESSKIAEDKKDSMDLQNWKQYFGSQEKQKQVMQGLNGRKTQSINSQQSDSLLLK